MLLNLGPNHPSTHGVLRLVATLSGETVVGLHNELGYVHTGIEKNMEQKSYWKAITYAPRADYNAFFCNELVYVMGVEKLLGLEVPRRGEWIRALFTELQRLHNHLIFLGTGSIDLGGIGLLFYCFRERDRVLDLFEMATGVRMHSRYAQVGGVAEDIPAGFEGEARKFLKYMRARLGEYEGMIGANPIFIDRTRGIGVISHDFARQMSLTGPNARASGIDWDLRVHEPYGAYRELGVQTLLRENGDTYDRYMIRLDEMRQSCDIIERILDGLPEGPWIADDRKVVLPPRHELHTSMESVIHHFKLVTEGFRVPAGEVYVAVEGPRGELGCNLVSDGTARPWRVHFRSASLAMLQSVASLTNGVLIADLIAILASLDPNMGDCDR
jgi:NADH-quinone oxidoreductase subunit D